MKNTYFIGVSLGSSAVGNHFFALGNKLVERGNRVVFLTWGSGSPETKIKTNPAIYRWPSRRPTQLKDALFLYKMIKKYNPDILIGNFGAVNLMLTLGFIMGVKYRVAWYRTISDANLMDWQGASWEIPVLRWRKRLVYKMASHIICNSKATIADVCNTMGVSYDKCVLFYNCILDPLVGNSEVKKVNDNGLILCVGRLHPTKGQDVLIRAVAEVKKKTGKAKVQFIGKGPMEEEYKQLAKSLGILDSCEFIGAVHHSKVFEYMCSASVNVVPSRNEAFGLVAAEALAVGTPVVASSAGGLAEIVRNGVDGFLVPPGDHNCLAEKLICLLRDRELRQQMGINSRKRFLDKFEQKNNLKRQVDWFESLLDGK